MEENGNVVNLIEELSCLNQKYVRKFFKINKKYAQPTDMYADINGGLCNEIFEKDGYDHLQI